MPCLALKLITVLAVLLMPLGMAAAPAALPAGHHAVAGAIEHCPDSQLPSPDLAGGLAECAMPCASALPAWDYPPPTESPRPQQPAERRIEHRLTGVLMEIATPPPKTA
jgi:hypothetical protein